MEQHCNRLRLDAIVAFLRAKGGFKRLRSERGRPSSAPFFAASAT
jgi:hypothetical protein